MSEQVQQEFITVTIDGVELNTPRDTMIIEVADQAGIAIPRFCYHKKLSVAANCRMCMVEVEKAPKPLPACATPVNDGMKIFTRSKLAIEAQQGTMEFLLINHPLDCPVCDQGGECELQDVAMGYGTDLSRFTERKRVVTDKNIGPLVSTDMTRCIHCTRCVRFGQEISGVQELGATGRGEFMEIGTYVEKSLSSELSGNVIDLCPVGALNAKPSRMRGRAWEMLQYPGISAHDSTGSNLDIHVLRNKVVRVIPRENETINETWIADRDRFSYEGMYSDDRLTEVMHKQDRQWETQDWDEALPAIAGQLQQYEPEDIGVLISPNQTNEEIYLLQKLARAMRVNNIDHRTEQVDFSDQANDPLFPWLGQNIADIENQDAILIIGSELRSEHPMIAHRVRKAAMRGAKVMVINPQAFEFYMPLAVQQIVRPQEWLSCLLDLLSAAKNQEELPVEWQTLLQNSHADGQLNEIAGFLGAAEKSSVLLGSLIQQHPDYASLRAVSFCLSKLNNARFGYLSVGSNATGAALFGALPHRECMGRAVSSGAGMNYREMVESPRKVYILMGLEAGADCALPADTMKALLRAELVICFSSYISEELQSYADWLLPVACYAEAEGSKVNMEGRWQSFEKIVKPEKQVKDAWKVIRQLGNELHLEGFNYYKLAEVNHEMRAMLNDSVSFSNELVSLPEIKPKDVPADDILYRVGSMPIYSSDALLRRASALQEAQGVLQATFAMHPADIEKYELAVDQPTLVSQGKEEAIMRCVADKQLLPGTVCVSRAIPGSEKLASLFSPIEID